MERLYNSKTHEWFNMDDEDFDKFCDAFATHDSYSYEDAISAVEISCNHPEDFAREYTEDEIKAAFDEHAELTGIDIEIKKNSVASLGDRRKAEKELEDFVAGKRKDITKKSAKTLLKVLESFDSIEFSHK